MWERKEALRQVWERFSLLHVKTPRCKPQSETETKWYFRPQYILCFTITINRFESKNQIKCLQDRNDPQEPACGFDIVPSVRLSGAEATVGE